MTVLSPRERLIRRSLIVAGIIIVLGLGWCVVSLFNIQIIHDDEYREKAKNNQLNDTTVAAARGIIYDSNMEVLAQSATAYKVYINPSLIATKNSDGGYTVDENLREDIAANLSKVLESVTAEDIKKKYNNYEYRYATIKSGVDTQEIVKVSDFLDTECKVSGKKYNYYIGIDPDVKRYYPYGTLASALIGFTGTGDVGRYGLEYSYDSTLTGVPGRIITAKNGAGSGGGSMPVKFETIYDAKQGNSIVLTLDSTIQKYLEKSLQSAYVNTKCESALGIIMDVDTGAVLGMANVGKGIYDPNDPDTVTNKKLLEEYGTTADAQYQQWKNMCVSDTYEPGSVFKIITLSAALEENAVNENTTFTCTGAIKVGDRTIACHNHSGHGFQTVTQGLMNSCNPFFITIGQSLGIETFFKYFEAFGFTEKTDIDLASEAIPRAGVTYHALDTMTNINLASSSFGQTFEVSPIQVISAISAIANGGKLMTPYVVDKVLDSSGNVISVTQPKVKRRVISTNTAKRVAAMMEMVVSEGTGKNAYTAGYRVAGKTGTSEKVGRGGTGEKTYWASFGCFAPANDPKIALLVVIDSPVGQTGGGQVAAPVAREILENVMEYLDVEPQYTQEEAEKLSKSTPSVTGLKVSDARKTLEDEGLTVKIVGEGETVLSQIPSSGQEIQSGGIVILKTDNNAHEKTTVPDLTNLTISAATQKAMAAGLNIKISGYSANVSELVSYSQDIEADKEVEYGTTVTVSFKSNTGVSDQTYSG